MKVLFLCWAGFPNLGGSHENTHPPPKKGGGLTRRELLKLGTIGLGSLVLSSYGLIIPSKAEAYPWNETVVTDRSFLEPSKFKIIDGMCSSRPDEIWFEGNSNAQIQEDPTYSCITVGVPLGMEPANLIIWARYNCIGLYNDETKIGCEVKVSNLVRCTTDAQKIVNAWMYSGAVGFGFGKFSSYTAGLWLRATESADLEYTFFETNNPENTISANESLVSASSLDSEYFLFNGKPYNANEGILLPNSIEEVYLTKDALIKTNASVQGRQSYEHCIIGYNPDNYERQDPLYDQHSFTRHGVSWINRGDTICFKILSSILGNIGFNIIFQPIANATPNSPVKTYKLTS